MKYRTKVISKILCCLCLVVLLVWLCLGRGDQGVKIKPQKEYDVGNVVAYCQTDDEWKDQHLGSSAYTMGRSGCLTSCIASALSTQWENTDIGYAVTPGELNQLFGEMDVYNSSGDIVWDHLSQAIPGAQVVVASAVKEIDALLAQGCYPIVKVKVHGHGAGHWVLLVGSKDGEYLCMDPLDESQELVPLSSHGGVVYRMRCVYWQE